MAQDPIRKLREEKAREVSFLVALKQVENPKACRVVGKPKSDSAYLLSRIRNGVPVKGGTGRKPNPKDRNAKLSAVAATGEPVLVRKGKLKAEKISPTRYVPRPVRLTDAEIHSAYRPKTKG